MYQISGWLRYPPDIGYPEAILCLAKLSGNKNNGIQGSHSVLEFKDVLEVLEFDNLGNVLEKSWNLNILLKCPGNVLEF